MPFIILVLFLLVWVGGGVALGAVFNSPSNKDN